MAIVLENTSDVKIDGVKILVYSEFGGGKTSLIKTLPHKDTVIISAEGGLLPLRDISIRKIEIHSIEDLAEAYAVVTTGEWSDCKHIAIDSITEIAEVVLAHEKLVNKDPRAAYGNMQETMGKVVRNFRDIEHKTVYMTAQLAKTQDDTGRMLFAPSMPGQKAGQQLPYKFDLVMALRVETDSEGNRVRALQTESDGIWSAKDRTDRLDFWEPADLGVIIEKANKPKKEPKSEPTD